MESTFLEYYFPATKTSALKKEIPGIQQGYDEPLSEYWERFGRLVEDCPNHKYRDGELFQFFYQGMIMKYKDLVNSGSGGGLTHYKISETRQYIQRMVDSTKEYDRENAKNVRKVAQASSSTSSSDYERRNEDRMEKIEKLLSQVVNKPISAEPTEVTCGACGELGHSSIRCTMGVAEYEDANAVGGYHFMKNRDHPNLRWRQPGGPPQQSQTSFRPSPQNFQQSQSSYQPPQQTQSNSQQQNFPNQYTPPPAQTFYQQPSQSFQNQNLQPQPQQNFQPQQNQNFQQPQTQQNFQTNSNQTQFDYNQPPPSPAYQTQPPSPVYQPQNQTSQSNQNPPQFPPIQTQTYRPPHHRAGAPQNQNAPQKSYRTNEELWNEFQNSQFEQKAGMSALSKQLEQLANSLRDIKGDQGKIHAQVQINPREENASAVTLRNGKELSEPVRKEKKIFGPDEVEQAEDDMHRPLEPVAPPPFPSVLLMEKR